MKALVGQNIGKIKQWAPFIYGLFLTAIIIDIGGAFGLKYATFGLLFIYLYFRVLSSDTFTIPVSVVLVEGILFVFAPVFYLFISVVIYNISPGTVLRELTPFAIWLLYPVLICISPRKKCILIFKRVMLFGAGLTLLSFILIYLFYFLGRLDLVSAINEFTREYRLGYFGQRPLSGNFSKFIPNVYFRWTLLLIPAATLFLKENKIKLFIVILALLSTLSTAAILFTIIAFIWVLLDELYRTKRFIYFGRYLISIVIFIMLLFWTLNFWGYGSISQFLLEKLSPSSASTSIKIGHIQSIISILLSNAFTFLFGMGVGSSFYSIGVNAVVDNVEVSHFNLIRQFGVLYALAFFGYIGWLFLRLYRIGDTERLLAIGLATLFIAAGTNPLLMSPVFFIVMVIARAYLTTSIKEAKAIMTP